MGIHYDGCYRYGVIELYSFVSHSISWVGNKDLIDIDKERGGRKEGEGGGRNKPKAKYLCFIHECTKQVATGCDGMCSIHHQDNGEIQKRKWYFIHECTKQGRTGCIGMCSRHHKEYKTYFQYL